MTAILPGLAATSLSACSFFAVRPYDAHTQPAETCTRSSAVPALDTVLAVASGAFLTTVSILAATADQGDADFMSLFVLGSAVPTLGFTSGAIYGFLTTGECSDRYEPLKVAPPSTTQRATRLSPAGHSLVGR